MSKPYLFIFITCLFLVSTLSACSQKQEGETTSWHLENHRLKAENSTSAHIIADCRGNNHLEWSVRTDEEGQVFPPPDEIGVWCGLYASKPKISEGSKFDGWGWRKTNWKSSEACTYETKTLHGKDSCADYYRAKHDAQAISAPWCQLIFYYKQPTTVNADVVTYCVTR